MGRKLGTHGSTIAGVGWTLYVGALLSISGIVSLLGLTQNAAKIPFSERGPMAAAALAIGGLMLLPALMRWKQSVEVFERGLVWKRLFGTKTVTAADVKSSKLIRHTGRSGQYDEVELELESGSSCSINGLKEAAQLIAFVRAWSSPGPAAAVPAAGGWAPPAAGGWRPPGS
jgi:hypothetical protein